MSEDGRYPVGANTKDAPWNQEELPEREIEVTVSVTLSCTTKIKVSDYSIKDSDKDEDGNYYEDIDYSNCNLESAVREQILLPYEICKVLPEQISSKCKINLTDWVEDDLAVIKN